MRKTIIVLGALAVALFAPALRASLSTGLVIQSWRYDREPSLPLPLRGALTLNLANLSGKDITAYNISITVTYADGSSDYVDGRPNEPSEHMEEMLGSLILGQLSGKAEEERPNSTIAPGTTRSLILPQAKDISDVKAVVDMVIYSDGTAEVLNERAFAEIMAMRKGNLLAMQKVNEVIKRVLADPAVNNPNAVVVRELTRELAEAEKHHSPEEVETNQAMALRSAVGNLERTKNITDLTNYAEDMDKRIALTAPHCKIQKGVWIVQ